MHQSWSRFWQPEITGKILSRKTGAVHYSKRRLRHIQSFCSTMEV
ncbi:AMP nucleosidase [Serratia marcescens]|nr:AMP nucleosidase [Serratia marcescens]TYR93344.1 AMP nucleosidase [Serratia marcescens]HAU4338146.1 AMP nucleosidase [Serratia marcescens]